MQSKTQKPKKLRVYVDLDPETAEAFEAIKTEIAKERGPLTSVPIAAGLLAIGIATYRQDKQDGKEFSLNVLHGRLDQMKLIRPSARKRATLEIFGTQKDKP